jgi:tetratricopeptide (TPR) repeat protein
MQCPHCGKSIKQDSESCEHCGKKISFAPSPKEEIEKKRNSSQEETDKKPSISTETKEKKSSSQPTPDKVKFPGILVIVFGFLILLIILFYYFKSSPPPVPPPPSESFSVESKTFFTVFREAIEEVGNAKSYYQMAQNITAPNQNAQPTTMPTETSGASKYLTAAENYARAIEHFKHAKQIMENIENTSLDVNEKECRRAFNQAVEKYVSASEIFNDYSKSYYLGNVSKADYSLITDAQPKYEVAEQSMSKILMEGCQGNFFRFVRLSPDSTKNLAYVTYKKFFLEKFEAQRRAIEMLFNYQPPLENLPPPSSPQK